MFEKNGAIFKRASKVIQDCNGFISLRFVISDFHLPTINSHNHANAN